VETLAIAIPIEMDNLVESLSLCRQKHFKTINDLGRLEKLLS